MGDAMIGLTPKDNELRMQVGFKLTHESEHQLYVSDEHGNWLCPMEALKSLLALVRQDEREICAKIVEQYHPESFFLGQVQHAANLIRTRGKE